MCTRREIRHIDGTAGSCFPKTKVLFDRIAFSHPTLTPDTPFAQCGGGRLRPGDPCTKDETSLSFTFDHDIYSCIKIL